ncbi:unnamed protein product [Hermetia illucens]|uniref:C2H2-type domain-containing protein n=1 Tax=Hermetia illucens TaxID=343691 RepID=A0A7R8V046_HERIL|nr:unnamed protein product [Hermetia illucens]
MKTVMDSHQVDKENGEDENDEEHSYGRGFPTNQGKTWKCENVKCNRRYQMQYDARSHKYEIHISLVEAESTPKPKLFQAATSKDAKRNESIFVGLENQKSI